MIIYYILRAREEFVEWIREHWLTYTGFAIGFVIGHLIFEK